MAEKTTTKQPPKTLPHIAALGEAAEKIMAEGIYFIRLKNAALNYPEGTVLYIGKGDNVDLRLAQELGMRKGPATFFRSLGLLLGEEVVPKSGKRKTGYSFKFRNPEEIKSWIKDNLVWDVEYCNWRCREESLIREHKPPLNIIYNSEYCHPELKELRRKAHGISAR